MSDQELHQRIMALLRRRVMAGEGMRRRRRAGGVLVGGRKRKPRARTTLGGIRRRPARGGIPVGGARKRRVGRPKGSGYCGCPLVGSARKRRVGRPKGLGVAIGGRRRPKRGGFWPALLGVNSLLRSTGLLSRAADAIGLKKISKGMKTVGYGRRPVRRRPMGMGVRARPRRRVVGGVKRSSPWVAHVKRYAKAYGIGYGEAMSRARPSYRG